MTLMNEVLSIPFRYVPSGLHLSNIHIVHYKNFLLIKNHILLYRCYKLLRDFKMQFYWDNS